MGYFYAYITGKKYEKHWLEKIAVISFISCLGWGLDVMS